MIRNVLHTFTYPATYHLSLSFSHAYTYFHIYVIIAVISNVTYNVSALNQSKFTSIRYIRNRKPAHNRFLFNFLTDIYMYVSNDFDRTAFSPLPLRVMHYKMSLMSLSSPHFSRTPPPPFYTSLQFSYTHARQHGRTLKRRFVKDYYVILHLIL